MSLRLSAPPRWPNLHLHRCRSLHLHLHLHLHRCRSLHLLRCSPSPTPPALVKKRKRYRKMNPGESVGIAEEMRFVAMRLRTPEELVGDEIEEEEGEKVGVEDRWVPSMEGFLNYLVDNLLVFSTMERIVEDSDNIEYSYFRKTCLERTNSLMLDVELLRQEGFAIPEPGPPGTTYVKYLKEISERSAPSFLCHLYCIYFAHITAGQVIVRQVSEELLDGKELLFNQWDGDPQELLRIVRDNLNKLGEHWSRDVKNKCLREAGKSFQMSGRIVRLIIS